MTDPRTPVDELRAFAKELEGLRSRLDLLEAPTGTSAFRTVAKLQALVEDIQAQLNTFMNGKYTNAEIDALIATRAPSSHTHDQSQVTGTWSKGVDTGSTIRTTGQLYAPDAYNTDITYTRRTAWWGNDGRAGYASSSRTKKTAIRHADEEAMLRILDAEPKAFRYRAEVRRRTSLRINEGRDYVPPVEIGLIAEELEELGLGWLVYHGENGEVEGIEYSMATVALLAVGRDHERRLRAIEAERG